MGLEIDVPAFGVFEILSDILSSESDTSGCSEGTTEVGTLSATSIF
jgi:hypothetical protein